MGGVEGSRGIQATPVVFQEILRLRAPPSLPPGHSAQDDRENENDYFSVCKNAWISASSCGLRITPMGGMGEVPRFS